jgi:hypothetical protein
VWIRSCDEWDTGEAAKKQSQFGGLTKLDAEADETRDDHNPVRHMICSEPPRVENRAALS